MNKSVSRPASLRNKPYLYLRMILGSIIRSLAVVGCDHLWEIDSLYHTVDQDNKSIAYNVKERVS